MPDLMERFAVVPPATKGPGFVESARRGAEHQGRELGGAEVAEISQSRPEVAARETKFVESEEQLLPDVETDELGQDATGRFLAGGGWDFDFFSSTGRDEE